MKKVSKNPKIKNKIDSEELKSLVQNCNKSTFFEFRNCRITYQQFQARVLEQIQRKLGKKIVIKTFDDFREELLPCFQIKAKGKDALLGRYLESKQPKQVKGVSHVERINQLELMSQHKVPDDPKCIRSIMPLSKNYSKKRAKSVGTFGRTDSERKIRNKNNN